MSVFVCCGPVCLCPFCACSCGALCVWCGTLKSSVCRFKTPPCVPAKCPCHIRSPPDSKSKQHGQARVDAQYCSRPVFFRLPKFRMILLALLKNVPETSETVEHVPQTFKQTAETMMLASHEQLQQQTVEHVPQTFKQTAETMRLASYEQGQQQTVEHVPQTFKQTAETMMLASHEQVQQQTVEHVPQIFKPVSVNTYIAPSVAPSLPDFSAFVNPRYSTTSVEASAQRIQEQIVPERIEERNRSLQGRRHRTSWGFFLCRDR